MSGYMFPMFKKYELFFSKRYINPGEINQSIKKEIASLFFLSLTANQTETSSMSASIVVANKGCKSKRFLETLLASVSVNRIIFCTVNCGFIDEPPVLVRKENSAPDPWNLNLISEIIKEVRKKKAVKNRIMFVLENNFENFDFLKKETAPTRKKGTRYTKKNWNWTLRARPKNISPIPIDFF